MATEFVKNITKKITLEVAIFPLATFRVLFGALMLFSTIRFWYYGWIEDFYLAPSHFFSYFGQDWILPYGSTFIYGLFIIMALSAVGIMLGLFFRASSLLFFLSFTYVELIDKTTYLNHYYFVSLIAFLLMLTPAHRALSLDSKLFPSIKSWVVPKWSILVLQCQIAILYFYAGIAKLNYDWLFKAQPMNLWLKSKADFPILGELFIFPETAFIFSWAGMLFDISIAFLLFSKKLRPLGYLSVVAFHLLTWFLFPIGIFPWVMIVVTLIFFSADWHRRVWELVGGFGFGVQDSKLEILDSNQKFGIRGSRLEVYGSNPQINTHNLTNSDQRMGIQYSLEFKQISNLKFQIPNLILSLLALHFLIQLAVPLRHHLSNEKLYWTENGYRFSWRVMLMEKTGHLEFRVRDIATQKENLVQSNRYFTAFQQRQLVTQPDMILQAAKIIAQDYENRGMLVEVYANSFASLNGERHRPFVNPTVNLANLKDDQKRDWIVQYD